MTPLEEEMRSLTAEIHLLRLRNSEARAHHTPISPGFGLPEECGHCRDQRWPCQTVQSLDGHR